MKAVALVVAGGRGTRMGTKGAIPKQFQRLGRLPVFVYPLRLFQRLPEISGVVLVVPPGFARKVERMVPAYKLSKVLKVTLGGKERQDSVRLGLREVPKDTDIVLIHDAARPCLNLDLIKGSIRLAAKSKEGVLVAIPVCDTLKRVKNRVVWENVDRTDLWRAQTPQVFPYPLIQNAYERAFQEKFRATDDAAIYQWAGGKVRVYPGEETNLKVTTPKDLPLARFLLEHQGSH